jgi:hypothetical protein
MGFSEQITLQTSPKAPEYSSLADRLFLAYLPSLPTKIPADLCLYCIAMGILFCIWVQHKDDAGEGFQAFTGSVRMVIDDALVKREGKVDEVGDGSRKKMKRVVVREGRVLKALMGKI